MTNTDDARVAQLRSAGLPFSLIGRTADTSGLNYVDLDFGAAVRVGLRHRRARDPPQLSPPAP